MNSIRNLALAAAAAIITAATAYADESAPARQPDYRRGWQLHDNACTGCHGASMYSRPYHERNLYFTMRKQVEIWQELTGLNWTKEQIDDVAYYVQKRFYERVCEIGGC